ncbi:TrkH family potassium uptake protein [Leucobacter luti]|uniref:Trk-type K+ transport system membrane component n=1 Tax=Leucobacter luti TaxID=340320 RepID=A0A4R6RX62_9MICO|nr:potassium transporter TrkG [Leucobacter luti]MCW2289602.1 Trk-type K+ transport system membrane component [Leucobacter luti]QYM74655.1 TrkH family potassium uptake protein [Leucobacter luti]TCK37774.1 Trk-type K+ transport system membrane component [Leucobacter luti]TDP90766.1 Trk-type K+ transport system membrane component [Leucobacter luti]
MIHSSPARFALLIFTALILVWTALLSLPIASSSGTMTPLADALFTAVSAICVTGLSTVDMSTHWSLFGEIVVLSGLQIGGIGVLTLASILGLTVTRRLGLRQRLLAAGDTNPMRMGRDVSESQAVGLGEIGGLLGAVALSVVVIEGILTLLITPHLMFAAGYDFPHALWNGFYLSASAFTNTGFVPLAGGLEPFATDVYLLTVLAVGVFLGAIGFPVIFALYRYVIGSGWRSHKRLGLHAKLTLTTTLIFVVFGWLAIAALEWNNQSTFGPQNFGQTMFSSVYMSIMTRSGGLGIIDPLDMNGSTLLVMDMLMFVGGGSASTAGGIKVTTIAVLFLAAWAEARGYKDVQAFGRSIPNEVLRVSVSILIWGATIVLASTVTIMHMTGESLDIVLFEVISAFGTCGLSSDLSAQLPDAGKYVLAATMWAGRVGTVTLAAAIAATNRSRLFRLPEERPIVG